MDLGGQAVIEGVMMRSSRFWALAVRSPDGSVRRVCRRIEPKILLHPLMRLPLMRGLASLASSLGLGLKALRESAEMALGEEEEGKGGEEEGGWGIGTSEFAFSLLLALGLFILLFLLLPTWLAGMLPGARDHLILFNLVEGLLRILVFVSYLQAASLLSEVRRMFQYHGAEHQVIHLYEEGLPLEPQEALRQGTDHLRCGTSFILFALVLTVLVYSLLGRPALWLRVLERLLLLPVVAGLAYEIMRLAHRHRRSHLLRVLAAPGLALQRLTTRRPRLDQVEVALASLEMVLEAEAGHRASDRSR